VTPGVGGGAVSCDWGILEIFNNSGDYSDMENAFFIISY
jgi:hypothetical protein